MGKPDGGRRGVAVGESWGWSWRIGSDTLIIAVFEWMVRGRAYDSYYARYGSWVMFGLNFTAWLLTRVGQISMVCAC